MKRLLVFALLAAVCSLSPALSFAADNLVDDSNLRPAQPDGLEVLSVEGPLPFNKCITDKNCDKDRYCAKRPGNCRGIGTCKKTPEACIEIYDPVCGCDGRTYPNDCVAAEEGVNVAHPGECSNDFDLDEKFTLRQGVTKQNPDENISIEFVNIVNDSRCQKEVRCVWEGNAQVNFTLKTAQATQTFILNTAVAPSAVDALGYNVELVALAPPASINNPPGPKDYIATLVISQSTEGCLETTDCQDGQFCMKKAGDCTGKGWCSQIPEVCPDVRAPVCGCNGKTYGNQCEAAAGEMNVARKGECQGGICDDGTQLLCKMMEPVCEEGLIVAIQDHCYRCVDPVTCRP